MKIKVTCTMDGIGWTKEIDAEEVHIRVGKKVIVAAAHKSIGGFFSWTVTSPETGARIAWADSKKDAVDAARKKILALGYARYWETVRYHQRKVLGGKTPDKAKRVSVDGYKSLSKSKLKADNIRRLEAAGAMQT